MSQEDVTTFLSQSMFVSQPHAMNLAASRVKGKVRVLPKSGLAEISIDAEPSLGICRLELEKHVLRVYEQQFGGKLLLCLNFDMYAFTYHFNDG